MKSDLILLLVKRNKTVDISSLVSNVKWSGRKGAAARSITAELLDDDGHEHARSGIDVKDGVQVIFKHKDKELFRGMIMKQTQNAQKKMQITAYDCGISLANNKDSFCYQNKTASDIFRDCCTRFGVPMGDVSNCSYQIPDLTKPNTTAFDAIADALSLDFDNTGIRHYVLAKGGKLSLLTRRENILQLVITPKSNLINYSYNQSIEKIVTRVKMLSKENATVAEKSKPGLEKTVGIFQDVSSVDESMNTAQINQLAASILEEKSAPTRSLTVECIGSSDIISGLGVFIQIPHLGLSRTFYVDSDTHNFDGNNHTMSLTLNYANDLSKQAPKAEDDDDYKVGDIVYFNGGYHYIASCADTPTGGQRSEGKAKITLIAKGAKHPYHLIGGAFNEIGGSCNVYGWVDTGTFTKWDGK